MERDLNKVADVYEESSENSFQFLKRQKIYRETGELYLDRLILIRCFLGSIMYHKIYLTDNDCLHDHPWAFISIILKGGYFEWTKGNMCKWYGRGRILFRPAKFAHRLQLYDNDYVNVPTKTLVFTGPQTRTWGFWTKQGWVRWLLHKPNGGCQ